MDFWEVSARATPRLDAGMLDVVDAIGTRAASGLARTLLQGMGAPLHATYCSVFHYRSASSVRLVSGSGWDDAGVAVANALPYIDDGIFNQDTNRRILDDRRLDGGAASFIHHQTLADIGSSAYRVLYTNAALVDRVSVMHRMPAGSWLAINFYRQRAGEARGRRAFGQLFPLAPFPARAVAKHIALTGAPDEASPEPDGQALEADVARRYPACPRRERQVMLGLLRGWTTDGIACHLELSATTVVTYKQRLFRRLGIHTRAQLFALFLEEGKRAVG